MTCGICALFFWFPVGLINARLARKREDHLSAAVWDLSLLITGCTALILSALANR